MPSSAGSSAALASCALPMRWPAVEVRRRRHSGQHRTRVRTDRRLPRRPGPSGSRTGRHRRRWRSAPRPRSSFIGPAFGSQATIVPLAVASVVLHHRDQRDGRSRVRRVFRLSPWRSSYFRSWPWSGCLQCGRRVEAPTAQCRRPLINFANIAAATALTFFAFTGFESATAPVGKVRDASRTIPRALLGGTGFVVLLYLVAGSGIQLLLPASVVANSPAPFADALAAHWGHGAASLAALASLSPRSAASMAWSWARASWATRWRCAGIFPRS